MKRLFWILVIFLAALLARLTATAVHSAQHRFPAAPSGAAGRVFSASLIPGTGDSRSLAAFLAVFLVSAAGIAVILLLVRKGRK